MTTLSKNQELLAVARTIKGTSFVGIQNYTNEQGETSNYNILVGASHEKMLAKDLKKVIAKKKQVFETITKNFPLEVVTKAYANVYSSLEKRLLDEPQKELLRQQGDKTILASDAQKDAYHHIAKGVKLHIDTLTIHIVGYRMTKKVLVKGIYSDKDSRRELTKCQDAIKKFCDLKTENYRTFKFNKADLKMKGFEL